MWKCVMQGTNACLLAFYTCMPLYMVCSPIRSQIYKFYEHYNVCDSLLVDDIVVQWWWRHVLDDVPDVGVVGLHQQDTGP